MSQPAKLELVSFKVCPFVQRSAIALNEKGVDYDLKHINLQDPPDWFKAISPLGKVPVLVVEDTPVFESAVILEYVDEVYGPQLHPSDPLQKAKHRAWGEFCSELTMRQFGMLTAADEEAFNNAKNALQEGLQRLDTVLDAQGPYFAGAEFHLVDCVYAPLFMRLQVVQEKLGVSLQLSERQQVWADALLARPTVQNSVVEDFAGVFMNFLNMKGGFIVQAN